MDSIHDRMVRLVEFLRLYKQLLHAQSADWQNVDEGLLEAFQLCTITKKQYQKERQLAQKCRFELISKEILLICNLRKFQNELGSHGEPNWSGAIESRDKSVPLRTN
jgi:hypothetical protein